MGFFDNLFGGGKKESDFTPSAELMPEDQFWKLIVQANKEAAGDLEAMVGTLSALLQKRPLQDLITFTNRWRQLRGEANTWALWGAAYIIEGGCSDDGFTYFRDWLIAKGPDRYKPAMADPESLIDVDRDEEQGHYGEDVYFVAIALFEERTGEKDIPALFQENFETTGTQWDEEGDDLERMFPRLWAKFSE
jgi:hypothetical protein